MRAVILAVVLISILGCDSHSSEDHSEWWGEAEARRNMGSWEGYPIAYAVAYADRTPASVDSFRFRVSTYWADRTQQEYLGFGQLPRRIGTYDLPALREENQNSPHMLYMALSGGDAVTDEYAPDESSANWIAIDAYDANTKEIEGRFLLTLIPVVRSSQGAPDTLRFEQGRFQTIIVEEPPLCPAC